jgi:hypothetical protein
MQKYYITYFGNCKAQLKTILNLFCHGIEKGKTKSGNRINTLKFLFMRVMVN